MLHSRMKRGGWKVGHARVRARRTSEISLMKLAVPEREGGGIGPHLPFRDVVEAI